MGVDLLIMYSVDKSRNDGWVICEVGGEDEEGGGLDRESSVFGGLICKERSGDGDGVSMETP